jgi:hypothetical protein
MGCRAGLGVRYKPQRAFVADSPCAGALCLHAHINVLPTKPARLTLLCPGPPGPPCHCAEDYTSGPEASSIDTGLLEFIYEAGSAAATFNGAGVCEGFSVSLATVFAMLIPGVVLDTKSATCEPLTGIAGPNTALIVTFTLGSAEARAISAAVRAIRNHALLGASS